MPRVLTDEQVKEAQSKREANGCLVDLVRMDTDIERTKDVLNDAYKSNWNGQKQATINRLNKAKNQIDEMLRDLGV